MSNFLAVDTSSRYLTVVAQKDGVRSVKHVSECAMQHSVILMEQIDLAMREVDLNPHECDYFAAVTGPGSFTGIRIGISCVKGMAAATGKNVVGVTSFDMFAYNVNGDKDFLVAIDALHGNYYACGYKANGRQDIKPCYLTYSQVQDIGRPVYGFENLPFDNYHILNPADCLYPAVLRRGNVGGGAHALYVKKSQAEEERESRGGNA